MLTPLFLYVSGLGWFLYGLYCFFQPQALGDIAGLGASAPSGATELRAMYGGLQTAIGLIAFIGAREIRAQRTVLLAFVCLYGGLASARALAAISHGDHSAYTLGALGYEALSCLISVALLRHSTR